MKHYLLTIPKVDCWALPQAPVGSERGEPNEGRRGYEACVRAWEDTPRSANGVQDRVKGAEASEDAP